MTGKPLSELSEDAVGEFENPQSAGDLSEPGQGPGVALRTVNLSYPA